MVGAFIAITLLLAQPTPPTSSGHETTGDDFRMPEVTFLCDATEPVSLNGALQLSFITVARSHYLRAVVVNSERFLLDDAKMERVISRQEGGRIIHVMTFVDRTGRRRASELTMEEAPGSRATMSLHGDGMSYDHWACWAPPIVPRPHPQWARRLER